MGLFGNLFETGKEGLGGLVGALDILSSLSRGNLGSSLQQRQQMLQDPALRESIGPFLAGVLGVPGGQQTTETPQGPTQMGPGIPQTSYQANLPPLSAASQIEQLFKQAQLGNALGDMQLTPLRAQLLQAQAKQAEADAQWLQHGLGGLGGGGGGGGSTGRALGPGFENMVPTGFSRTGPTYGKRETLKLQSRTRKPGGGEYATGDLGPGGEHVVVDPSKATIALRTAAGRAQQVLPALTALITPDEAGETALSRVMPSGKGVVGKYLTPLAQDTPLLRQFTPTGRIGSSLFGTSLPALAREGNQDAVNIQMIIGEAGQVIKSAGGDTGVLTNQDWERFLEYMLPTNANSREEADLRTKSLVQKLLRVIEIDRAGGDPSELYEAIMGDVPASMLGPTGPPRPSTTSTTQGPQPSSGRTLQPGVISAEDFLGLTP